jgi:hypothetical protein
MTSDENKLKPCPFCGGEVNIYYQGSSDWTVEGCLCPVSTHFWISGHDYGHGEGEHNECINRWNTRADMAVDVDPPVPQEDAQDILRWFNQIVSEHLWGDEESGYYYVINEAVITKDDVDRFRKALTALAGGE